MTDLDPLESLYFAALERAPADRSAYLDEACRDKPELRERVERLLAAKPQIGEFLQPPAVTVTFAGEHEQATVDFPGRDERIGAMLAGKYKLIEAIGEGGMGSVFMAQQTQPVKRNVAVKVIKAGMDSKAVLARFEAERQALAMMDHPNIARVLDAGTTDGGRPFFVMELVKGVPITEYCDAHKLTPRQRLELFVPVCNAIQHAHQKGVIHRDIKPSNVLVALYDDKPVPKVIDFGLAKAAGQTLTDKTLMTGFGAVVGTPEYMSPEQASLNNLDIDTRSDVYSLGVLLYELLTGSTPVDRKSLGKAALMEILRIVREVEAPKPSAKLSTIDTLPSVAANRGSEPAKLSKMMRGELDWLVLKALEKDRSRRYDTANGFAADIQRYLADEIVEARPPSVGYRLRKFVRRHKGQVLAASMVMFALLAGIAGTSIGLIRATRAAESEREATTIAEARRIEAEASESKAQTSAEAEKSARAKADEEAANAKAVNDFLLDDLLSPAVQGQYALGAKAEPNPNLTVRALMERAEATVSARFADRPLVESNVRNLIEQAYRNIDYTDSEPILRNLNRVTELLTLHYGPDHPRAISGQYRLAMEYEQASRTAKQPNDYAAKSNELVESLRNRLDRLPKPLNWETGSLYWNLAMVYHRRNEFDVMKSLLERFLALADQPELRYHRINARLELADMHKKANRNAEALALAQQASQEMLGFLDGSTTTVEFSMLSTAAYRIDQRFGIAFWPILSAKWKQRAIEWERQQAPNLFECWIYLGLGFDRAGQLPDALQALERVRGLLDRNRAAGIKLPSDNWANRDTLFSQLASVYLRLNRREDALATYRRYLESNAERGLNDRLGENARFFVARVFIDNRKPLEAIPILRDLVEFKRKVEGPASSMAVAYEGTIIAAYLRAGQFDQARGVCDEQIARFEKDADQPNIRKLLSKAFESRAQTYTLLQQPEKAAADVDRAIEFCDGEYQNRHSLLSKRAISRLERGLVTECLEDAERLAKTDEIDSLYNAACFFSKASGVPDRPAKERQQNSDRAMALLKRSLNAGYRDFANLSIDTDLNAIRIRADFRDMFTNSFPRQAMLKELRKSLPPDSPELAIQLAYIGSSVLEMRAFEEAEVILRECITIREKTQPDVWSTFNTRSMIGGALLGQKKYAEAEPLLLKGYEGMKAREKAIPPQGAIRIPDALDRLIDLYTATNKPDDVKKWRAERAKYPELAPVPRVVK